MPLPMLFIALVSLLSAQCSAELLNEPPSRRASKVYVKPTQAVVSLPVEIPLTVIRLQAEKSLPDTLHTIDEQRNGPCVDLMVTKKCLVVDLKGWVKRNGDLTVGQDGHELLFKVPLKAQITAKGVGKVSQHVQETGFGALTVALKAKVGLNNRWQTQIKVTTDYTWDEPFFVEVAGIKVSLQSQADVAVQAELVKVAENLEKQLQSQLDLAGVASQVWSQLQQPQLIHQGQNLWLKAEPQSAFIEFIGIRGQAFVVDAGVAIKAHAGLARPKVNSPKAQLPNISRAPKDKGIALLLPMALSYEQIAEQLAWRINDEFTVDELNIYPHRNRLVLAVNLVHEGIEGTVHIVGTPVLDEKAKQVRLTALSYTQPRQHALWRDEYQTLREQLLIFVEQVAHYDYGNMLNISRANINEHLGAAVAGRLKLQGALDSIKLSRLITAEQGLVFIAQLQGSLAATWSPPPVR